MMFCHKWRGHEKEVIDDFCGSRLLSLDLADDGLQSSFYYFLPEYYEFETQRYIREYLKPGMAAFDVGAHHGLLTILMADCVGKEGEVYSFEPERKNFMSLKQNIELNNFTWVHPMQFALSNKNGEGELISFDAGSTLVSVQADISQFSEASRESVQMITLDDFVEREKISRIDLIKIDAEGGEHLILEGAKRCFSTGVITQVICEIHSSHKTHAVGHDKIRKIFYDYGYKSYVLNPTLAKKEYLSELSPSESVMGLQNLLFRK